MNISDIRIGERHRKDLGDVASLAQSIADIGLLHPVVVTPDGTLIAGARRVAACKLLGWQEIPATVVDLQDIVRGEHDENALRKDFTPSEAVAIARALEPMEREAAKERQLSTLVQNRSEKFSEREKGEALVKVARTVGMSQITLTKAREVVEAAEQEPELFAPVLEQMDRTGNVHGAYKELKKIQREVAKATPPPDLPDANERYRLICADIADARLEPDSLDIIITDPPYSQEFLPVYAELAKFAAHALKPGGSMLVMVGQSYLPEVLALMTPYMRYHWTLAYLTPGGQSVQLWQRKVNTFWKPVLWFVKGEYAGDWIGDVAKSAVNDNDKRFHDWGQSESGMADLIERFTYPGQTICDPFVGGGTTGVVALQMNRQFVGIDSDPNAIVTTKQRIRSIEDGR